MRCRIFAVSWAHRRNQGYSCCLAELFYKVPPPLPWPQLQG
jgi:hypothetical protein